MTGSLSVRTPERDGQTLQSHLDARVLNRDLAIHGAVLYRGFAGGPAGRLSELVDGCGDTPLIYDDPATPRTALGAGVYTSTDYPATELIPPHHEAVYSATWPRRLYFACARPATSGGATTLADAAEVLADLSPAAVRRFRERGVTYIRTFHPRLGIPWQKAFGTQNPDEVLAICAGRGTSAQWIGPGVLQTRQTRPAVVRNLANGQDVFFNQVLAHHPRSLPAEVREALTDLVGANLLPKQVRFGNNEVVDDEIVDEIAAAYARRTVRVDWQADDVLVVDNMRLAHGREPYTGERAVRTVLAGAMSWGSLPVGEPAAAAQLGGEG